MRFVPKITYNGGTVVPLTIAQRLWEPEEGARMGDEDVSAAGIPEAFWVGWDYGVRVTIRFTDLQRVAVMTFLEWAVKNKGTAFTWRFDKDDSGSEYSVYLGVPRVGDMIRPTRSADAPWVWEQELVLRSSAGSRMHYALFES